MNWTKAALFAVLVLANVAFLVGWLRARRRYQLTDRPTLGDGVIGLVTDFLDTLGIGSYAPTTALFKFRGRPADELIPGTLNIGKTASAFLETVLFVSAVEVEPVFLASMIASATLGAWLGAGIVSRLPRRAIQIFMGIALLVAAFFFVLKIFDKSQPPGTAIGLSGWRFVLAISVNFVLGALMSAGIGNYAPSMIMLGLLGVNQRAAYPIMMGSDGILQPIASLAFFRSGRFAHGPSLGLLVGGVLGVLIAFPLVNKMPLDWLRWIVVVVVTYAALSMLRSARAPAAALAAAAPE